MKVMFVAKYFIAMSIIILSLGISALKCQDYPGLERFRDSAHHWYDIKDEERVINPLPDRPQYSPSEYLNIADNILLFQKENGGWLKNYDVAAILTSEQVKILEEDKSNIHTTFDNGSTHSQLTYLAEVYKLLNEEKYKKAFLKGMNFVLAAQYENGGWPQTYPDSNSYHKYITFNDGAMQGIMDLLYMIVSKNENYRFLDDSFLERVKLAYNKGIECILNCQIAEDGIKKVWCQQHDNVTLKPQDARAFEKASLCSQESAQIIRILMRVENPSDKIIDAVNSAVGWFKNNEIYGIRMKWIESTEEQFKYHKTRFDRIVVEDEDAPRIWARFYELETGRPIFSGRDGKVTYSMMEIDRDRRTGYGWYTYEPETVFSEYEAWKSKYNK